jgi:hypothetical protein
LKFSVVCIRAEGEGGRGRGRRREREVGDCRKVDRKRDEGEVRGGREVVEVQERRAGMGREGRGRKRREEKGGEGRGGKRRGGSGLQERHVTLLCFKIY